MQDNKNYTAFVGTDLVASGARDKVVKKLKSMFDEDHGTVFLVFEDQSGKAVDFDLSAKPGQASSGREAKADRTGPGRPRLGVVCREISLLPRHWEWLEQQPAGASAAIRRLVEEAIKRNPDEQQTRRATEATGRFITAVAGNLPGYEEASRALYARDPERFGAEIQQWPRDIRQQALRMLAKAFPSKRNSPGPN